ncbi:MAG: CrcB family protein [Burkholderiaceae bacterium]
MSVTPIVPAPAMVTSLSPLAQAGAVAVGGAVGSVLRWRLGVWLGALQWPVAPGILVANLAGGLCIGFSLVAFDRMPSEGLKLLLVTGLLGGLTTFSSFSGESLGLMIKGQWGLAAAHTLIHVAGALFAAALGWSIGRWVWM